ncbi:EamA family transporter [Egbenema bharatensis]|uniref:EamA family transporter n=1 Tax=Egbenema bharatensis TaxID=3463334 RepID=UPI003A8A42BA
MSSNTSGHLVDRRSSGLGLAAIALAATLWAIAAIVASNLLQGGISPFELTTSRAVIAAGGLAIVSRVVQSSPRRMNWRVLLLGLSLAMVTATYYIAISRLSVAVAIVIQYTAPAIVVAIEALKQRRVPPLTTITAVMGAIAGVILLSGLGTDELQIDALGLMAAGLSALFFCSCTLLSESVVDTYGAIGVMYRAFLISSLFWVAFQFSQGFPTAIFLPENRVDVLFVGIGGTLIPFCLMCWGIQQVRAERGAIAATLEPVIAAVLAWLWLGQTLSILQMTGGILVITAVASLQIHQAIRNHQANLNG